METQNLQQVRCERWSPQLPAAPRSLSNKIQKKDERERKTVIKNPDHFLLLPGSIASLLEKSPLAHSPSQLQLQCLSFPRFPSEPCQINPTRAVIPSTAMAVKEGLDTQATFCSLEACS